MLSSASLTAIIAALVNSITACIMACVMFCSDAFFVFFFSPAMLNYRQTYVNLLGFSLCIFKYALCETYFTSDTMQCYSHQKG